jgi:hypothetical protein
MARFRTGAKTGAGSPGMEHQAGHVDTPNHGETSHPVTNTARLVDSSARASGARLEPRDSTKKGRSRGTEHDRPAQWRCTFEGRGGGQAHATFASVEQAKAFAERHAKRSETVGEWVQTDGFWVLSTPVGDYLVRPM